MAIYNSESNKDKPQVVLMFDSVEDSPEAQRGHVKISLLVNI